MIAHLPRQLGWHQEDSHQEKLHKLEQVLGRHGFSLPDVVPLFATLLALPLPDHYPPLALSPQWQKHKILETLLLWLLRETERQPVLFIVEDLHWLDPSTLEFLGLLVDQAATMRLFALLTCRPTFRSPWAPHAHLTYMTLSRLPRHQASLLIEQVAEGRALPAEVHQQLLTRTDGVPLFVEELTKMVLESEWFQHWQDQDVGSAGTVAPSKPLPQLTIPATLQDSLTARLDRLGTGKLVAQLGATIGRRFSYELLRAVSPVDEATLQQALGRLVEAELLYRRGLPPQATYLFKHALIQEAAYQSLLKSMRQRYHQQIAQALVERFPETIETQPELLAHHYTEAGLAAQAVPYWLRAGQRATERSANVEAISHLTEGLELLKTLPDTPERVQHEFALQMALGAPLLMIKGHTAPEVEHAYTRALELCQHMGDDLQRFSALAALWGLYLTRPQFQTARDLAAQGFALAQRMEDQAFLQEAHVMLGAPLFYLGELVSARAHLEQGVALYHPQPGRGWVFRLGADPGVRSFAWAAWTLWLLGYPDRALATMAEALSTARQVAHAYTLAWVLHYTATLHGWCGEIDSAREQAEAEIRLSNEQGFVRWSAGGMTRRGWSLAMQGAIEEGIAELRQGVATWRVRAGEMGLSSILAQQAEAFGRGGYLKEGLDVLAEALAIVHRNAEHYYEAELHRLKGELLRSGAQRPQAGIPQAAVAEAEACFRRALNVARRQEAKSLELRAALSLSRLWQTQDKRKDARQLLTEIYGWFSEGFDTRDLQEARALLATLA
jgi:predicted ATPase